jgi:transposase
MNKRTPVIDASELAIDLAKHVFEVVAADRHGHELWHRHIPSRKAFETFLDRLIPPLCVGMETGPGAQAWGRRLQARGITVKILPANSVKAHGHRMKNDLNDARAILRAMHDHDLHPVPVKTEEQLALQAQHRVRARWVSQRTAVCNQLRSVLLEQGLVAGRGAAALETLADQVLRGEHAVACALPELVEDLVSEWRSLSARIDKASARLTRLARRDATAQRLCTAPGIGPITATAVVAKGLDPHRFPNARQCAAYLGIVPEQHGTGGRVHLGKMSRRGDGYLRSLFIEGAQSVVYRVRDDATDPLSCRVRRWKERHGTKGAAVRLANHNVRVVWAMLLNGEAYHANPAEAAMTR